jgi:hypothetical protein
VEVSKKTTQSPSIIKRRRVATTKQDNTHSKRPRKENTRLLQKIVNVSQPVVNIHPVDKNIPQSITQARYINENASTSKNTDDVILMNHKTSKGIQDIFINYTSYGEVYDSNTTIVNSCFSINIVKNVLTDPYPKTMTKCKMRSDWNKWK